jgi:hypothetical protein
MHTVQRRRRTVLARFAAASLVVALGAAGSFVAPSAATAAADDRISVRSITQFGPDSAGYYEIIGEVQNAGATALGPVRVDFSFYSADNTLLSTDYTFSDVSRLAPGEKSPFSLHFEPVPEYDHYSYSVSDADFSFQSVNHNFTVTVTNRYNDGLFEHVVGTVRNDNTTTAEFVSVVGTAYTADGKAVDASESFINNSSKELAPGTSATYELIFFSGRPFQNYALLAESSSTPSTDSSSPSPAPSTTRRPHRRRASLRALPPRPPRTGSRPSRSRPSWCASASPPTSRSRVLPGPRSICSSASTAATSSRSATDWCSMRAAALPSRRVRT